MKLPKTKKANNISRSRFGHQTLKRYAHHLADEVFKSEEDPRRYSEQLLTVCTQARDKDFLIVHNPGGWGHASIEDCLDWERGIIDGVTGVLQKMGYTFAFIQYFRSGFGWREEFADFREQLRFFSDKSSQMANWLRFIIDHIHGVKVVLIGVSQGAAFGNAVMQHLGRTCPVYSIELGFPFLYKARRVKTGRILAIDGNGIDNDKLVQGTFLDALGIFLAAPFKWLVYRIRGKPKSFPHCVDTPGHRYEWGNVKIQRQIRDFLRTNFGRDSREL